ncbi:hypothetical protein Tco_1028658 [Tanacetum coccineum]|uniref:Uncharacterized protein n=1 Tax=Tanacetum coccineum TaxID=301880 RepID=A0ABQ5G310_9ASTR
MSNSEDSMVTYMEVSSPFEDLSDIGSPRVIIHGYDGLPMMPEDPYAYVEAALQAPLSPDYVFGPKEPKQAPPPPDFVPEPVYQSYITESDPEEDPEEDDKDPEEDPADYPTDRDDEEEEEESFGDNADDEDDDKDEDKDKAEVV